MAEFYVEWRIEVDAVSAEEAAERAYNIMRDQGVAETTLHVFAEGEDADEEITLLSGKALGSVQPRIEERKGITTPDCPHYIFNGCLTPMSCSQAGRCLAEK